VQLPAEWYIPRLGNVELQTKDKKQGGRFIDLSNPQEVAQGERYILRLMKDCQHSYDSYLESVADGIAMEQARNHLHVNHYTHWLWKQDLHNLMHLLSLRDHGHAQWEIQQYAQAIYTLLQRVLPESMKVFDDYRRRS
jgi:thymidylate synthase (FAD)